MSSLWHRWQKEFARSLTIMVVPHGTAKPRQLSFSLPFLIFLFACWTGFTGWASYMASQRFDYWRVKANSHLLKIKLDYFASQLKDSREMLDEVREMDAQLRALINMGSRDAIIQGADVTLQQSAGGPNVGEVTELQNTLEGAIADMSFQEISRHMSLLRTEMERRMDSFKEISAKID